MEHFNIVVPPPPVPATPHQNPHRPKHSCTYHLLFDKINMTTLTSSHFLSVLHVLLLSLGIYYFVWIYAIDSPKFFYYCPLDRVGLTHLWNDENCYWSSSYPEARSKFLALGNRIREQVVSPTIESIIPRVLSVAFFFSSLTTRS